MRVTCSFTVLCRRTAEVPSHDRLPHDDSEQRKLQCSQDDAEIDAYSESDSIFDEFDRSSKVLIVVDLSGAQLAQWRPSNLLFGVVVRMDEFALFALIWESVFISSSHVSVFRCCSRWT